MDPDPDSDPDPATFVIDLQEANKKQILKKSFLLSLFEGTFIYIIFQRYKVQKNHKSVGIKVFPNICA